MQKSKILYVDDETALLEVYKEMFRFWGHEADTFSEPNLALQTLENNPGQYQVLLVDCKMPDISGIEFLEYLRNKDYFGIKWIALFSSMLWEKETQKAIQEALKQHERKIACINKEVSGHEELKYYLQHALEEF